MPSGEHFCFRSWRLSIVIFTCRLAWLEAALFEFTHLRFQRHAHTLLVAASSKNVYIRHTSFLNKDPCQVSSKSCPFCFYQAVLFFSKRIPYFKAWLFWFYHCVLKKEWRVCWKRTSFHAWNSTFDSQEICLFCFYQACFVFFKTNLLS